MTLSLSLLSAARRSARVVRDMGLKQGTKVLLASAGEVQVTHPSLRFPVTLRTDGSDVETFRQVIAQAEYELPCDARPRTIVDAGANIGLASCYFASRFPYAKIIALEPEPANYALAVRNTAPYGNVRVLPKALWKRKGTIQLSDPGLGSWGFQASEQTNGSSLGSVPCLGVEELLEELGTDRLDLLKIDIEGGEVEVFDAARSWIDRVDVLVAELHDRLRRGCSRAFYTATAGFPHETYRGENVFVWR